MSFLNANLVVGHMNSFILGLMVAESMNFMWPIYSKDSSNPGLEWAAFLTIMIFLSVGASLLRSYNR